MFAFDVVVATTLVAVPLVQALPPAARASAVAAVCAVDVRALADAFSPHTLPLLLWASVALCMWRVYAALQAPFHVVRPPSTPRRSRGQRPSEFPPPFPNGWFALCHSDELPRGAVRECQVLGQQLVLFRNARGGVGLLDGFCPHLGANLGVAGVVHGDCLKCCFHGWEFDRSGACARIPGASTIPPSSGIRAHRVAEVNHMIFCWHHSDGDGAEPWELEALPELQHGSWWYESGRTWCQVHAHIQELPENGADAAHLNVLHEGFVWDTLPSSVATHRWSCEWQPNPDAPHQSLIALQQGMCLFGHIVPGTRIDARIEQMGPGIVRLRFDTPFGAVYTFEFVTPHRTTTQVVRHVMYCSPTVPRLVGKFLMWGLEKQFQRDVPIWESKKFESRPVISKGDGPILAFRRWFSQFYADSSLTFSDALAKENMMDW